MRIRFGYVSHALSLWDCSPAKTMTFTRWTQLEKVEREETLYQTALQNIQHTMRTLYYNVAHDIPLYRMSSSIIPLATHPEVDFDYIDLFRHLWTEMGQFIKKHNLRVSFHPNQFTLFTSDKSHITDNAVVDMEYHYRVLEAMNVENPLINIHIGGAYGNKEAAIARFHENIKKLPLPIKQRMTLENDDKTYTAKETLAVCQKEHIPLVFDYHHHLANPGEEQVEELLSAIFSTWSHTTMIPKVHLSSPKSEKEFRAHADFVDVSFIKPFLDAAKQHGQDFDVMIESKRKDQALLKLMEELAKIRGYKRIGGAIFEI